MTNRIASQMTGKTLEPEALLAPPDLVAIQVGSPGKESEDVAVFGREAGRYQLIGYFTSLAATTTWLETHHYTRIPTPLTNNLYKVNGVGWTRVYGAYNREDAGDETGGREYRRE